MEGYISPLHDSYATFICSFPWDLYETVTFRRPRRDAYSAARSLFTTLYSKFGAERMFVAVERFSESRDIHLHALSRHTFEKEVYPERIWKYLFKKYGRTSVEVPRGAYGVSLYCSKYVTKSGTGDDFYFFGDKEAWNLDVRHYETA